MNRDQASSECSPSVNHPVDMLLEEHAAILAVLDAAEQEVERLENGGAMRQSFWYGYLDFMTNYADRCHHRKEEDVLFSALEEAGLPREGGPTDQMRHEHELMRKGRSRLAELLTGDDIKAISDAVRSGINMLREHIAKENEALFPAARRLLSSETIELIRSGFARVKNVDIGEGEHDRFAQLGRELCAQASRVTA